MPMHPVAKSAIGEDVSLLRGRSFVGVDARCFFASSLSGNLVSWPCLVRYMSQLVEELYDPHDILALHTVLNYDTFLEDSMFLAMRFTITGTIRHDQEKHQTM